MILNNLNPNFAKTFKIDYYFEEVQKLKFSVYDIDNETQSLGDDDFLGEVECTLGHVSIPKILLSLLDYIFFSKIIILLVYLNCFLIMWSTGTTLVICSACK